jgi:hypothetical protein
VLRTFRISIFSLYVCTENLFCFSEAQRIIQEIDMTKIKIEELTSTELVTVSSEEAKLAIGGASSPTEYLQQIPQLQATNPTVAPLMQSVQQMAGQLLQAYNSASAS